MVFVTKADGSLQLFEKDKVVRTCLRMGASLEVANKVAVKVEGQLYDGISTRFVLQLIFRYLSRYEPVVRSVFDLKRALSLMVSKPEFELFVQVLLAGNGFEVEPNQVLKGKCVGHEVDGLARKEGQTYFVEAKHHKKYHSLTGLDESRIARAIFEDVNEGYELGRSSLKVDRAMIVTNTRFSDHAIRYGYCRNILQIGWSTPEKFSLQKMIEEKKLYPLSCLKFLNQSLRLKLVNSGVVLIAQLLEQDQIILAKKALIEPKVLKELVDKTRTVAHTLGYS